MKNILLRILLLIVITFSAHTVRAEWVQQWNENFNSQTSNVTNLTSFKDWSNLDKCSIVNNASNETKCLRMGDGDESGSATTSSLGVTGYAKLTFTFCKGTNDSQLAYSLEIRILGEGSIDGTTVLSPKTNSHETKTVYLKGLNASSKLVFIASIGGISIDNIVVSTPSTIILDQNADNSSVLAANNGGVVNVETVRTLREGIWNTLCLPFTLNKQVIDEAFGENQDCRVSTYTSYANNVMTFSPSTVNSNTSIAAGTPFLIKVNATVTNPTFKAVTITTTTPGVVTDNGVSFVGCYSSTEMATDGTELFIGTDNYMYKPEEGKNIIGGLRAFIRRSNTAGSRMSVNIDEESLAVTAPAKMERTEPTAYTLQGVRTNAAKKGVYIVDGKKRVIR